MKRGDGFMEINPEQMQNLSIMDMFGRDLPINRILQDL
jgi:hypothetical protein